MSDTKEKPEGLNPPAPSPPSNELSEAVKTLTKADIANHVGDLMDEWNGDDKL